VVAKAEFRAGNWITEGKQAATMTRLSCHCFRSNEAWLGSGVIAYNLGNLWRRLALPKRIENWSSTSLQHRLVKTGGQLVKHARYYWLLLAEGISRSGCSGRCCGESWLCRCPRDTAPGL
jgi:DDE family transposase